MTFEKIIGDLRGAHPDPLANAAFTRLEQILGERNAPITRQRLKAYAEAEAQELSRQAANYETMQGFYHPNVAAARAAEAEVMRDLAGRL